MLPEWHEQLRSGDQGFLFRAMVTTDSAEVTGILEDGDSNLRSLMGKPNEPGGCVED